MDQIYQPRRRDTLCKWVSMPRYGEGGLNGEISPIVEAKKCRGLKDEISPIVEMTCFVEMTGSAEMTGSINGGGLVGR